MTNDDLAARLLLVFTEELDDQVRQLNDDLLALERAPHDAERLRGVFRVMHTLKGAARAAGLTGVETLCHALEGNLTGARDGGSALGGGQIALLFEAADALQSTRDGLRAGRGESAAELATVLQRARARAPARSAALPPPTSAPTIDIAISPVVEAPPVSARVSEAVGVLEASSPGDATVRVAVRQVDAIVGAAGEVAALAATMNDRAAALAELRSRCRGASDLNAPAWLDRELRLLARAVSDDARGAAAVAGRLGSAARRLRQRPLSELTEALPRLARDVANELGRAVRVELVGGEIEADRVVLESLREPLAHLVRNAIDHGLEGPAERLAAGKAAEGVLRIAAELRGDRLVVTVGDDGRGVDLAALGRAVLRRGGAPPADPAALARTIFNDGLSTRDVATAISGRGVGMGIVRVAAERMGGTVDVRSASGAGTSIIIDVPISVATMRAVLLRAGAATLAVPSSFVARVTRAAPGSLPRVDGRPVLVSTGAPVPVITLASLLGSAFPEPEAPTVLQMIVLEHLGARIAVVVDDLLDERELVLRPLEHAGPSAAEATVGTALLSDGAIAVVLSVPALFARAGTVTATTMPALAPPADSTAAVRILVVDDSITSRTLQQSVLRAAGYEVLTAVDGADGWRILERADVALVVSDVEMPQLDGFALCARIRATARTSSLPVILVTSLDDPAHRLRGLEAGADAYLSKGSFDQDTLLDTVRALVGVRAPLAGAAS